MTSLRSRATQLANTQTIMLAIVNKTRLTITSLIVLTTAEVACNTTKNAAADEPHMFECVIVVLSHGRRYRKRSPIRTVTYHKVIPLTVTADRSLALALAPVPNKHALDRPCAIRVVRRSDVLFACYCPYAWFAKTLQVCRFRRKCPKKHV
jgi:hypothetical protein